MTRASSRMVMRALTMLAVTATLAALAITLLHTH
jgi:hypothetical protein